jgi:hypothetical protein
VTLIFICRLDPDWHYHLTEGFSSSGSSILRDDGARPPPPANLSEVGWPDPKKQLRNFAITVNISRLLLCSRNIPLKSNFTQICE